MNTKKAAVVTDEQGRTLWAGAFRPGRMHDQTAVRTEGIAGLFRQFPQVKAKVDAGYRGLAKEFPDQVQAPPLKPEKDAPPGGNRRLARAPSQAVIRTNLRRACQRRAQANGEPSSATSDDAKTSTKPTPPSPAWSPTAPPSGNHQPTRQASTPQR